jgi:hypothetical protein
LRDRRTITNLLRAEEEVAVMVAREKASRHIDLMVAAQTALAP